MWRSCRSWCARESYSPSRRRLFLGVSVPRRYPARTPAPVGGRDNHRRRAAAHKPGGGLYCRATAAGSKKLSRLRKKRRKRCCAGRRRVFLDSRHQFPRRAGRFTTSQPPNQRHSTAVFTQSIRDFWPKGFLRNPTAPAANTCVRVVSSARPETKIVGAAKPSARRRRWSSTPLKPGICTSVIRQDV